MRGPDSGRPPMWYSRGWGLPAWPSGAQPWNAAALGFLYTGGGAGHTYERSLVTSQLEEVSACLDHSKLFGGSDFVSVAK